MLLFAVIANAVPLAVCKIDIPVPNGTFQLVARFVTVRLLLVIAIPVFANEVADHQSVFVILSKIEYQALPLFEPPDKSIPRELIAALLHKAIFNIV